MIQQFFYEKLLMEIEYVHHVGERHRKALGQFFTHTDVAGFMTNWVLNSGKQTLFDPAFGLGVFHEVVSKNLNIEFSACEVDPKIIEYWEKKTGKHSRFIAAEDYLHSWGRNHSNIVCNPPYMRFQKFINRDVVFQKFQQHLGIRLSGYTNAASAFLLKSLSELTTQGRMAYIMPLEFLNTGYGTVVKARLLESGHLFAILEFACERDIFPDAITSVGIILCDSSTPCTSVKFFSVKSIAELAVFEQIEPVSDIPLKALDPKAKWLPYFQKREFKIDRTQTTTLGTLGRFSRGIATGANEFFVLRPSNVKELGIDEASECVSCITRSSQIRKSIFDATDYNVLFDSDEPVLLFSTDRAHSKEAKEYIRFGEHKRFNERFLTKNRKPWYKTEKRSPSPLLLGVFSRGGYKVILNKSQALNLTCFHGFQPNLFGSRYIEHLFLYLSSKIGRSIVSLSIRKYGDSLDKFEPNDLNGALVPAPALFASMPAKKISEAVVAIKETGQLPQWAEDFFTPLKMSITAVGGNRSESMRLASNNSVR